VVLELQIKDLQVLLGKVLVILLPLMALVVEEAQAHPLQHMLAVRV
jgi:hypothetical protein